MPQPELSREQALGRLEVLYRLESVRRVSDAILAGQLDADPELIASLVELTESAARWARWAA